MPDDVPLAAAERWSRERDVSEDVAHELRKRCADQDRELPESLERFMELFESAHRQALPA